MTRGLFTRLLRGPLDNAEQQRFAPVIVSHLFACIMTPMYDSFTDARIGDRTMAQGAAQGGQSTEFASTFARAFARLHKRNFGIACGVATATLVVALTLIHLVRSPGDDYPLRLLSEYFAGYTVSVPGAIVGGLWAGFTGFVAGWFFAFCRNLAVAVTAWVLRTRATVAASRDFLDHI
jgi:hypothetical protein